MVKFANVTRQHLSQKKKINKELIWIDPPEIYFLGIENPPPHHSHWKISKKLSILDWCMNASLTLTTLPASLLQHLNVDYTHKQPRNEVYKCGENKSFSLLPVTWINKDRSPSMFVQLHVAAGIGIKCNFESDQSRQKRISHPSRRLNCGDINFHGRADIFSSCKDSYIRWGGFPPTSIATIFPTFGSLSWSWPISYIFCEGSIMNYAGYIYGKNIDARTWWILRN